jgi:bifunctional enzyme CysN/CysC
VQATGSQFEATLTWHGDEPMLRGRTYSLRAGGGEVVDATISPLKYRVDPATGERFPASQLEHGEVGVCGVQLEHEIAFDPAAALALLDPITRRPVGTLQLHFALRRSDNVHWQELDVDKAARGARNEQVPCVVWLTGLSGAGKSTIANLVERRLHALGRHTYLLDGDNVRHGLNKDLGFTEADRVENIRRVAEVAKLMVDAGLIVIAAFISPFASERRMARSLVNDGEFIEVHVDAPLDVAEQRDPKGLYAKARRGELVNFTGIDSPYEAPESPEVHLDTAVLRPDEAAERVVEAVLSREFVR